MLKDFKTFNIPFKKSYTSDLSKNQAAPIQFTY